MDGLERRLARYARALATDDPVLRLPDAERPTTGAFVPTDDQWAVVDAVLSGRLAILTGGPGTGKTATMRALVDLVRGAGRSVRLCAPTGKAARRLSEATGASATTIHRLLGWIPDEGFEHGPDDPITGADVLVVDEASMLSVHLADALLGAVGPRTHVLLVGDVDQLPPVGAGAVLGDLIDSGVVPTVRLTEVFRQAARSLIVRAAHAINHGEVPATEAGADDVRDFFLLGAARRRGDVRRGRVARRRAAPVALRPRPARATCSCSRRCTAARSASTRSTPSCARGATPTAPRSRERRCGSATA